MRLRVARWLWKVLVLAFLPFLLVSVAATAPGTDRSTLIFADGSEPIGLYPPPSLGPPGSLNYLLYDTLVGYNARMEPDPRLGACPSNGVHGVD